MKQLVIVSKALIVACVGIWADSHAAPASAPVPAARTGVPIFQLEAQSRRPPLPARNRASLPGRPTDIHSA
jgi:hypothetical protein